jgi:peptide/nickel transport system substrate-binding protein
LIRFIFLIALVLITLAFSTTLNYAILVEPKALNVWVDYGPHAITWSKYVFSSKYRSLYRFSHVTFDFVPDLAEDMPAISKEGSYTVYTVKLREGLRWSDGSPITADDVAFTLNSAVQLIQKAGLSGNWESMVDPEFFDKAEPVDDRTVRIYFKKTGFLRVEYGVLMVPIIQEKYWKNYVEAVLSGKKKIEYLYSIDTVTHPDPSSGPFVLRKWEKGAFIELDAVKDYFDKGYTEIHYENGAIVLKKDGYTWKSKEPRGEVILKVEMLSLIHI